MKAILALEDGTVFHGNSIGAQGERLGEVVFNTAMTGYQEILTDPSYKGQIITMTYPEIGNYGVNPADVESGAVHASGFVVRQLSPRMSNFRARQSLGDYLRDNHVVGLEGVDTRALTKRLRVSGALKGLITTAAIADADAVNRARAWGGLVGVDTVKEVTCAAPYQWDADSQESPAWHDRYQLAANPALGRLPLAKFRIVAIDCGIKRNILRRLREQGLAVTVVPAHYTAAQILALKPDGVFLANGPGDPAALTYVHRTVRDLLGKVPLFGICLGHQMMAHAFGGRTFKLKFGHRGGNQPVQDLRDRRVTITSQNHGFAVDPGSLPADVEVTHINLNDGTCEGMRHKKYRAFSVQYHPEAAPGPHDAGYFFAEFRKEIERGRETR
ncbi:MAG: glutamine-hydrolyzing carbamoyl-phosphate synthase small subunit [Verrucomicrobiales bacterium]|jgi:carbamoyl-phosphate synthase small subunit|nr:glutamine-hydrolyzing carbamoyl-phosphate synthase small subunit [Verrucomicrobiales bacterium]